MAVQGKVDGTVIGGNWMETTSTETNEAGEVLTSGVMHVMYVQGGKMMTSNFNIEKNNIVSTGASATEGWTVQKADGTGTKVLKSNEDITNYNKEINEAAAKKATATDKK